MSLSTADAQAEALAAGMVVVGLRGTELQADEAAVVARAAGVALFGRNVADALQLRALCAAVQACGTTAPLVCVDREGGRVDRLRALLGSTPSPMALGAIGDADATREAYAGLAGGALSLGAHLLFAPVADVNTQPRNPVIGTRSFGDDPDAVARHVAAAVAGVHGAGAAACAKHFPGHGAADMDSHVALPRIDLDASDIRRSHLPPFEAAVAAGVDCVMTAHVAIPALDASGTPATWSRVILEDVLRGELGFDGVIISDDLEMGALAGLAGAGEAAVRALHAGCDLVVFGSDGERAAAATRAIADALLAGRLDASRIHRTRDRIARLRAALPASGGAEYDDAQQRALAARLARRAVTVVRGGDALPLAPQAGERAFVIDFCLTSAAQRVAEHSTPLGRALSDTAARVHEQARSLEPSGHEYKQMLMAAGSAQIIIAVTRGAFRRELQARAVADLALFGARLVVIAAHEPYDAAVAPDGAAVIATYGDDDDALAAAAEVMLGRATATGGLPVRLPAHE